MNEQRAALQRRIAAVRQEPPGRRRYGPELKRDIAAYGLERRAQGLSNAEIAAELGLDRSALARWLRHAERRWAADRVPFEKPAGPPPRSPAPTPASPAPTPASHRPQARADEAATGEMPILVVHVHQLQVEMDAVSRQMVLTMLDNPAKPPTRS